jgi:8-oxo-dGTP pyrophosphatase MutT (NUDIX family)
MEELQVFDINGNLINKKVVRGDTPTGSDYIMIVYVFIKNSDNKYLLERNATSGMWVIPGGHVCDTDPKESVKRECKEELGIDIDINNLKHISMLNRHNRLFNLFYIELDTDINQIKLQKEEVEDVNYFTKEEIERLIENKEFRENNIEFFEELIKYLQ